MPEYAKIVIATGRFQTVHLGSLNYLQAAKGLATEKKSAFYLLTGPLDHELPLHGYKAQNGSGRRLMLFEERRFLISLMLSIPASKILNNESSPHHGEPGLSIWANAFFNPLIGMNILSDADLSGDQKAPVVEVAVVMKQIDFKNYRPSDGVVHYAHYLKCRYRNVLITDLGSGLADKGELALLGASEMGSNQRDRTVELPATMVAAEILIGDGYYLTDRSTANRVIGVFRRFGNSPQPYESVARVVGA